MKSFFVLFSWILLSISIFAQTSTPFAKTKWTNGIDIFTFAHQFKEKSYFKSTNTQGTNNHFYLISSPTGKLSYRDAEFKVVKGKTEWKEATIRHHAERSKVERKTINEKEMLIFYTIDGQVDEVLYRLKTELVDFNKEALLMLLEGSYDCPSNSPGNISKVEISTNSTITLNGEKTLNFKLNFSDFGIPDLSASTENGNYTFAFTLTGLNIYQNDSLLLQLRRNPLAKMPNGIHPLVSQRVFTRSMFAYYHPDVRQYMRNDAYARHGYYFVDSAIRDFYLKLGFYKTAPDIRIVNFSEVEQLNISLIEQMVKKPSICPTELPAEYKY